MPLHDSFGKYVCDIKPTPIVPLPKSMRCCRSGVGPPSDADGQNGQTYIDLSTGDLYVKTGGTWNIVSGGAQVYEGRDPAPPDDVSKPALSFPTGGGTLTQWSVALQAWE